jgi:RND superfamily putative drug exporter
LTGVSRRPRFIAFDNPQGFASGAPSPVLERSGRFIYRRRYAVIVAWAVLVLAVMPFAPRAREFLKPGGFTNENFQSVEARRVLQEQLDVSVISVELIFVHRGLTAYEPEYIAAVETAVTHVRELECVKITK